MKSGLAVNAPNRRVLLSLTNLAHPGILFLVESSVGYVNLQHSFRCLLRIPDYTP